MTFPVRKVTHESGKEYPYECNADSNEEKIHHRNYKGVHSAPQGVLFSRAPAMPPSSPPRSSYANQRGNTGTCQYRIPRSSSKTDTAGTRPDPPRHSTGEAPQQ